MNKGSEYKFLVVILNYPLFSFAFIIINEIQNGLFLMVIDSLWIPNVLKIDSHIQRKICSIGLIKLLTECPQLFETHLDKWISLLDTLIKLFEERPERAEQKEIEEDYFYFSEDGFEIINQNNSNLIYASKSPDSFSEISESQRFFVDSLRKFSFSIPGKVFPAIQKSQSGTQQHIQDYFQLFQIPQPFL